MEPPVRILCLLVFAASIAAADSAGLLLAGALIVVVTTLVSHLVWQGVALSLIRIRWLLLSLLVLYGWFSPGDKLVPALGVLSPATAGLAQGSLRVVVLLLIIIAVHLLVSSTSREQLLAALYQLTAPLKRMGLPTERFAVRAGLVLEVLPKVQDMVAGVMPDQSVSGSFMRRAGARAREVFTKVSRGAEESAVGTMHLPEPRAVTWYQWLYPLLLLLAFWFV